MPAEARSSNSVSGPSNQAPAPSPACQCHRRGCPNEAVNPPSFGERTHCAAALSGTTHSMPAMMLARARDAILVTYGMRCSEPGPAPKSVAATRLQCSVQSRPSAGVTERVGKPPYLSMMVAVLPDGAREGSPSHSLGASGRRRTDLKGRRPAGRVGLPGLLGVVAKVRKAGARGPLGPHASCQAMV